MASRRGMGRSRGHAHPTAASAFTAAAMASSPAAHGRPGASHASAATASTAAGGTAQRHSLWLHSFSAKPP